MSHTVLLVEDSPTQALQTKIALEEQGFDVLLAKDGLEALELVRRERPDAILSDILMPEMDGFQLVQELKDDPELQAIPIILNTATYRDDDDRSFALRAGADAYIEKDNLAPEMMSTLVQEVIDRGRRPLAPTEESPNLDEQLFRQQHTQRLLSRLLEEVEDLEQANVALQQRVAELQVNLQTARSLSSSLDMQATWRAISKALQQTVAWDVCALLLTEPPQMRVQPLETVTQALVEKMKSDLSEAVSSPMGLESEGILLEVEEPPAEADSATPRSGVSSSIQARLTVKGGVIGVVGLYRFSDEHFSEDDQRTLSTLAAQAALAFENARLFAAQERRAHEMETLYYVTANLSRSLDLRTTLDEITQAALELVEGDSSSLMLLDRNG